MSIKRPIITEIAYDMYMINEFGLDCMTVICGDERALVIDTGMGYCDFKSIIAEVTSLPYEIVITHGHVDHAGGWGQFEEVYIHPTDVENAQKIEYERRVEDGDRLRGMWGDPDVWEYSREDVRQWECTPRTKALYDGQVFDLGGRKVTCVYTPGHSRGSCSFIDDRSRVLLSGDACNTNLGIAANYVTTCLRGLLNLKRYESEFDRSFNGHMGYASDITAIALPDTILDDCIGACRSILDGTGEVVTWVSHLGERSIRTSVIYGSARISFSPERIWEPGEKFSEFIL